MKKEEIVAKIADKMQLFFKLSNGTSDHVSGLNIPIDISKYLKDIPNIHGSFVSKMYADKIEVFTRSLPWRSYRPAPGIINCINYSDLDLIDLINISEI